MLCFVLLMAGAEPLSAHDPLGFDGTVVKMDLKTGVLTIETIDNGQDAKVDITFSAETAVTQNGKKVPRSALKAGLHVTVDALGCIDSPQIDGVTVRIVPPGTRMSSASGSGATPPGVSSAPASEQGTEIPKGDRVPTVKLHADGLRSDGWSFSVVTTLVLTSAMGRYEPMHGHLHVYLDGEEVLMIAAKHFTLNDLAPGVHTVRVVLSGTDHRTLLHGGVPIADSQDVIVPATGR